MQFEETGLMTGRTLMLLPGTCCDWQTNFGRAHFIYANKMGEKYLERYKKYFHDPDIREFNMQHEQWLFGGKEYAEPVLKAIDEFMEMEV